jgi:hypothetical protein
VYIYRDTSGQPGGPAADSSAQDPAEQDASYWYDLVAEGPAPKHEETRGPFEPLVSSSGPSADAAHQQPAELNAAATAAGLARAGLAGQSQAPPDAARDEGLEDAAHARARKLEQIRDFYLTAEAIGEQNVDKHFDQLLARQRELISEYFEQSAATKPAAEPARGEPAHAKPAVADPRDRLAADAEADLHDPKDPNGPGTTGGQAGPPERAGVAADQPRAW